MMLHRSVITLGTLAVLAFAVSVRGDEPAYTVGLPRWVPKVKYTSPPPTVLPSVDEATLAKVGIRKLTGRRSVIYTDLTGEEIDALPVVLDAAFPQWCEFFQIDDSPLGEWRLSGCVMKDKAKFVRVGLIPNNLPDFANGYSQGADFWINEQPTDYYRRHLVLHEGTHCFMNSILGGVGPTWYAEGIAELLGTHRWKDGKLTMNYFPDSREETPQWGRINVIRKAYESNQALSLVQILDISAQEHQEKEAYSWSWALATLLERNPRCHNRFRTLSLFIAPRKFNLTFAEHFRNDIADLAEDWAIFTSGMEYGYDFERTVVDFTPGKPLDAAKKQVAVASDRGWQNAGIRLEAGKKYLLTATGSWEKKCSAPYWKKEYARPPAKITLDPNGVSIRYYQSRPLGALQAVVLSDKRDPQKPSPFLTPNFVGGEKEITPESDGTLFLRVNDSAADLASNTGRITVVVEPIAGQ